MTHRLQMLKTSSMGESLAVSPRTPVKKKTKGDPIVTGIRLRPFLNNEKCTNGDATPAVRVCENMIICEQQRQQQNPTTFKFTNAFDYTQTNLDVYEKMIRPAVYSALQGYNTTVLAYGQTASGKTHSIFGSSHEEGILGLSIEELISLNQNQHLKFETSFFEIYKEKVTDLLTITSSEIKSKTTFLSTKKQSKQPATLEIREHPILGPYVPDLKYVHVQTKDDFIKVLSQGQQQRTVGTTKANQRSSRSHAIFTIKISRVDLPNTTTSTISTRAKSSAITKKSKPQQPQQDLDLDVVRLNFVDLAGSEKSQEYAQENERFAESVHINQSLSVLRAVIDALSRGQPHVPYRDSNLTYLLKSSLGGDSKTYMLATISPCQSVIDETLNTLRYASRASTITNVPRIKTPHLKHEIEQLREENEKLKHQVAILKENQQNLQQQQQQQQLSSLKLSMRSTLMLADESVQTTFIGAEDQEQKQEEKDTFNENILAQIENTLRKPKKRRFSEMPLKEIENKKKRLDETTLQRRLTTLLGSIADDVMVMTECTNNTLLIESKRLDIKYSLDHTTFFELIEKLEATIDDREMNEKQIHQWLLFRNMPSSAKDPIFNPGDLVWSQIAKYPFWPGLIYSESDESSVKSLGDRVLYKVYFFDSPTTYDWYSKRAKQIDSNLSAEKNNNLLDDIYKANELSLIDVHERLKKFQEHLDLSVGSVVEQETKTEIQKPLKSVAMRSTSSPLTNIEFINHMLNQSQSKRKIKQENNEIRKSKTLKTTNGASPFLSRTATSRKNKSDGCLVSKIDDDNTDKKLTNRAQNQMHGVLRSAPERKTYRHNSARNHPLTSMTTLGTTPGLAKSASPLPTVHPNVSRIAQKSTPLFVKIAPRPLNSKASNQLMSSTISDPIILSPNSSPQKPVLNNSEMAKSTKPFNYTITSRSTEQGEIISTATSSEANRQSSNRTSILTNSQSIDSKPLSPQFLTNTSLTATNCGAPKTSVFLQLSSSSIVLTPDTDMSSSTPRNLYSDELTTTSTSNILPRVTYDTTPTVSYQPLSLGEEFMILDTIKRESNGTFNDCKSVGEQTYSKIVQINNDRPIAVSEFWFYMFVFRYIDDFISVYPNWLQELEQMKGLRILSTNHEKQIKHLILLMKAYKENERH
ncbi:unnamed protein product [Didymodactylos carnosus]|uniref:Uncharacterized protein n=1 Tax=Didymodactylos carnosus TaxID=1234261 RepID=A0A814KF41_9BILA|nr:unnamed protein product [Didymodactylos carnosus]CAF1048640.1 unnamed protein product [Didymodactylos carnosus]CAF3568849.1 unnamed protein product [Didymodactylos carnosus]CAF3818341.1 unnamed protein product [Didymodactylos carnosus]